MPPLGITGRAVRAFASRGSLVRGVWLWFALVCFFVTINWVSGRQTVVSPKAFADFGLALVIVGTVAYISRPVWYRKPARNHAAKPYLVTYTDRHGTQRVERLESPSARALKDRLVAEGGRDIQLHDDDHSASFRDLDGMSHLQSPKEELAVRQPPADAPGTARWHGAAYALAGVGMIGWGLRPPWSIWSLGSVLFGSAVLYGAAGTHAQYLYQELRHARAWNRHDDMLRFAARLAVYNRLLRIKMVTADLEVLTATAQAGKGDLPGALRRMEALQGQNFWSETVHLSRLSGVYAAAKDHAGMLDCLRRAYELSDGESTAHIDYALGLALTGSDPTMAQHILNSRTPSTDTPAARVFIHWAQGLIFFEQGNYQGAAASLADGLEEMVPLYNPQGWEGIRFAMQGALGRALAYTGQDEARELLEGTMAFVIAQDDERILKQHRAALAVVAGG